MNNKYETKFKRSKGSNKMDKIEYDKIENEIEEDDEIEEDARELLEWFDEQHKYKRSVTRNDIRVYKRLRKKNTVPDFRKFLYTNLLEPDKIKLFNLFHNYYDDPNDDISEQIQHELELAKNRYALFQTRDEHYENKLKELKEELDDSNIPQQIISLPTSLHNKQIIYRRYLEYENAEEKGKYKTWLNWALSLPYNKIQEVKYDNLTNFLKNVKQELDKELYGMEKVKEDIIKFLSERLRTKYSEHLSLALIGNPGTGKTTIVRLLSKITSLPFVQISCNKGSGSSFLKGHDFTYIGSQPGEIVKCLNNLGCSNGMIFFDEYDKLTDNNLSGDILQQLTDYSQNKEFQDDYLSNIKIDLSNIWFIFSMNQLPHDRAIRDRLIRIIEIPDYNMDDKCIILEKYMFPKYLKKYDLLSKVVVPKETVRYLVNYVGTSMRDCDRLILEITRNISFQLIHPEIDVSFKINISNRKIKLDVPLVKKLI